jgi:hypothetical protein
MSGSTSTPVQEKPSLSMKHWCANCSNCKLITSHDEEKNEARLRVRCSAGMWKKKLGEEKMYKYFTVVRRSQDNCPHYEPMGDEREFLQDLRYNLPVKDEIYDSKTLQVIAEED